MYLGQLEPQMADGHQNTCAGLSGKQEELFSCLGLINKNSDLIVAVRSYWSLCVEDKMDFHIPTSCKKMLNFALAECIIFLKNY